MAEGIDPNLVIRILQGYMKAMLLIKLPDGTSFFKHLRKDDFKLWAACVSSLGKDHSFTREEVSLPPGKIDGGEQPTDKD